MRRKKWPELEALALFAVMLALGILLGGDGGGYLCARCW